METIGNRAVCGKLMLLIGLLTAAPLLLLPVYPGEWDQAPAFVLPAMVSLLAGGILWRSGRHGTAVGGDRATAWQSSIRIVLFAWFWGVLTGAVPFFLSGQLNVVQALFESVSGWTTTGLSVMDVSGISHLFLFYRSFMQYCGGLGFILMMIMVAPDRQSMDLFNAEGHPDKLMPNLKRTAQAIFLIYLGLLLLGTAAYVLCGMPLFDSVCHAMCSLSTGGFSTKCGSIGEYRSPAVEGVTVVLMLLGATNFAVLLLLVRRKWRQAAQVSEVRFQCLLLLAAVPLLALSLCRGLGLNGWAGLRHGLFNAVSALSTTGYATMDYQSWPPFAVGLLILLMLTGGGIGSTAGGLKLTRVYLLLRMVGQNVKGRLRLRRSVDALAYVKAQGRSKLDPALCSDTLGFVGCYFLLYATGTLLLAAAAGCGLETALFEFASALGTVGLSMGLTGPSTGTAALLVEMTGMVLGRLEIFPVLTGVWLGFRQIRGLLCRRKRGRRSQNGA